MELLVLGLNHKSAPLHIREKVAFPEKEIASPLAEVGVRSFHASCRTDGVLDPACLAALRAGVTGLSAAHDGSVSRPSRQRH